MKTNPFNHDLFQRLPVVGILRGFNRAQVEQAVLAAAEGGLCNVEVTMNTAGAAGLIAHLQDLVGGKVNVGAGTVCSLPTLEEALAAGAVFIVTPTMARDVVLECVRRGVPVMPGAMSPSEIQLGIELGAMAVKVFPSEILGPGYIRALKGPFPEWRLMPTGGVTVESLPAYHQAGAAAYGVGTPLFDKRQVLAQNWGWIQEQARRFAETFQRLG